MEYKQLVDLIDKIDQSSLAYLEYEESKGHVILSKHAPIIANQPVASTAALPISESQVQLSSPEVDLKANQTIESSEVTQEESIQTEAEGEEVVSPMVGVVYLQANPDADPYVQVGDTVEQGDVLLLVEAMKLMNEIQAPKSGVVTEILVENEQVVEFNQPLIKIK